MAGASPSVIRGLLPSAVTSRRAVGVNDGHPYGDAKGERVEDFRPESDAVLALAGITDRTKKLDGDLHWYDLSARVRHPLRGEGSGCAEGQGTPGPRHHRDDAALIRHDRCSGRRSYADGDGLEAGGSLRACIP